jgi:hypothetical protein
VRLSADLGGTPGQLLGSLVGAGPVIGVGEEFVRGREVAGSGPGDPAPEGFLASGDRLVDLAAQRVHAGEVADRRGDPFVIPRGFGQVASPIGDREPSSACSSQMLARARPRNASIRSGPSRPGLNSSSSAAPASKSASSIRLRARSRRNRALTAGSSASAMASSYSASASSFAKRRPGALCGDGQVRGRAPRFSGFPPLMREEPRDVAYVVAKGSLEVRRNGRMSLPPRRLAAASHTRPHGLRRA